MQNDKPVVFSAKGVSKTFGAGKNLKTAVDNVTFDIYDEEFISIVGGSGCGKNRQASNYRHFPHIPLYRLWLHTF